MRAAYEELVETYYAAAVEATNAHMVNAAGRKRHVNERRLIAGPGIVAMRRGYASEELLEFLRLNPLPTVEQFERQWFTAHMLEQPDTPADTGKPAVYLSRRDVAERLGVKPDSLSRTPLPDPDVLVGDARGWRLETIAEWASENGRTLV